MTRPAQQLRIRLRIPVNRPQPMQLRPLLRQWLSTLPAPPLLELPLLLLQLPPLRRRAPLVELQPLHHIPPHLEPQLRILPRDRVNLPPHPLQNPNRLRPVFLAQRRHRSLSSIQHPTTQSILPQPRPGPTTPFSMPALSEFGTLLGQQPLGSCHKRFQRHASLVALAPGPHTHALTGSFLISHYQHKRNLL